MAIESKFLDKYKEKVKLELQKKFNYSSSMQIPKFEKVVISIGLGKAVNNKGIIQEALNELTKITGQKAVPSKAKKSIAAFKLREGMNIGVMVTLRGQKMYDFLEKLITVSLPRVRDFRGLNQKSFDSKGNYSIGVKEFIIFPEIDLDRVSNMKGVSITIVTSTDKDEEARELLKLMGFPLAKK